jgi:hypothetical protein
MLPGYKEVRPMVFCGLYPIDTATTRSSRPPSGKLQLNDSAFVYRQESSVALGFGFRCGFLGLLHMEIIQERIRREHDVDIISTYPSVIYQVVKHGETIEVDNPVNLPDPGTILEIREPTSRPHPHPERERWATCCPHHGEARRGGAHRHARRDARHAQLRPAAQRDPGRFQRPPEEHHPRLRLDGLRARRYRPPSW